VQKTTILWKCLYLLASLKASSGLGGAYETNRSGGEESPVHGQSTTVNVGKIRDFRQPYAWAKTSFFSTVYPFTNSALFFVRLLREPHKEVPFHSIIGDRGLGDGEQGSDGVVPYTSAHLAGAASELIVPTDHAATAHPLTVLEVKRILHLHLQQAGLPST
jgi:hypothetical protein